MFGSHFSDHKKSAYAAEARQYESMSSDDVAELFANNLVAPVAPGLMKNTPTRLAEYVQFHSMDDPDLYPSKIFDDPNNFEPYKDWRGRIIWWGILPVFPEDSPYAGHVDYGDVHILMRRKMNHNLYMGTFKESEIRTTPEVQFTDVLIEKKISELSSMDLGDLTRRDYRLKITLDDITDYQGNPRIWREFSVSGGISIAALADKVITPVMGWVRNYHAHAYTVFEDGAVFGPTESRAVDKMHMQSVGWNLIPEKSSRGNWTLAHLLQREGQEMIWLYDYGDNYTHYIRVEEIASVNDSTGKVAILDGSGACPREDGDGNSKWKEDIAKLASPHQPVRAQVVESIRNALNYKGKTISSDFDPDNFDIIEARERVHAALASPDSVWSGPKTWVMPLREDFGTKRMPGPPGSMDPLRRGQKYQRTSVEGHESEFMQEVVSSKRDKKSTSCCWSCGNPHDLMSCARCHKPLYCGTECQTAHWKASHKRECRKP